MSVETVEFDINGEWLTNEAREQFYIRNKGYEKCLGFLSDCMRGTEETEAEIRRHSEDLLLGRAALKGSTRDRTYHLEVYDPNEQEIMPSNMNIWKIAGDQIKVRKELEQYKKRWSVAMKIIPKYLKEEIAIELDEDLTEPESQPAVPRALDNYMKRMLDTEEHTTEDYGWLEPNGKFHAVEWGDHQKWAYEYLESKAKTEEEYSKLPRLYEAGDVLTKEGWALLHNPSQGIAMATRNPCKDYTKAQKEFLFGYYMERNCEKEANDVWSD